MRVLFASLVLLAACGDNSTDTGAPDDAASDDTGGTDPDGHEDCIPSDEVCDGLDNDCDGAVDEDATDAPIFFADGDGDGAGEAGSSLAACQPPDGYVSNGGDCDDADADVHPMAEERCATVGVDDDCDGSIDEDDAVDALSWYADVDGDGAGDRDSPVLACEAPADHIADGTDCDDTSADVYPGAPEICDGVQSDCSDSGWSSDAGLASFQAADGETWADVSADLGGAGATELAAVTLDTAGTLALCEGTWALDLDITADVEIVGKGDPTAVVVTGLDQTTVVDIATDGLSVGIADLTLADGYGDSAHPSSASLRSGGGVSCQAESALALSGVTFQGHDAAHDAAVMIVEACEVELWDVTVQSDLDDTDRDLIVQYGGTLLIDGGHWDGVVSDESLVELHGSALTVQNADFDDVTVEESFFFADGDWDGVECSTMTARDVTVTNSDTGFSSVFGADPDGCAISITDSTFTGNQGHDGVVAVMWGTGTLSMDNVTATGNTADYNGVALTEYAEIDIVDSTFSDNLGGESGAMYLYQAPSITITDTVFSGNTGEDRGTIWLDFGDDEGAYTLDGVVFDGNTAAEGGCIVHRGGTLELVDTTFMDCTATDVGGALLLLDGEVRGTGTVLSGSSPDDAYVDDVDTAYTLGAAFTCTTAGCTVE